MRSIDTELALHLRKALQISSTPHLADTEKQYRIAFGLNTGPFTYSGKISADSSMKIADAYEQMSHAPTNILVKSAYQQLAKELMQQFYFLNHQVTITYEPYQGRGEPYRNSQEMIQDINRGHLYFFKTESGFGEDTVFSDNIMLTSVGFKQNGYTFVLNDIFRILHDVYGHAKDGFGFGPIGEDRAWFTHMKMFSPLAAAALSTETRGQNSWVNFGPHMRNSDNRLLSPEDAKWLPPNRRPFAEQKMNLLPETMSGIRVFQHHGFVLASYIENWNPLLV